MEEAGVDVAGRLWRGADGRCKREVTGNSFSCTTRGIQHPLGSGMNVPCVTSVISTSRSAERSKAGGFVDGLIKMRSIPLALAILRNDVYIAAMEMTSYIVHLITGE